MITLRDPRNRKNRTVRIELIPLVDTVFILLTFFVVSTTFILDRHGMKLQLPAASSVSKEKAEMTLTIDSNKDLFFDKVPISLDQVKPTLEEALKTHPDLQIAINAHEATPYTMVIQVLDEVRLAGCYDVILEAQKKSALLPSVHSVLPSAQEGANANGF